jgi:hypothetical protein
MRRVCQARLPWKPAPSWASSAKDGYLAVDSTSSPLDTDNLPLFIDIIDSSSFPILSFIRHLILRFMDRSLDDALLEKIHYCPNLRSIEVRIFDLGLGGDIGDVYQSLETHLPLWASNAPSLSQFHFNHTHWGFLLVEPRTVFDIIRHIPSMEYLAISGSSLYMRKDSSTPTAHLLPPRWRALDMDVGYADVLLSALLRVPIIPVFKSLKFDNPSHLPEIQYIEAFLLRAGGELESLSSSIDMRPETPGKC